jgi:hypothetical protein
LVGSYLHMSLWFFDGTRLRANADAIKILHRVTEDRLDK